MSAAKICLISCCVYIVVAGVAGITAFFVLRNIAKGMVPEYKVTEASLRQFNMTSKDTLDYNLALTMTIENNNKYGDIKFEKFDAVPMYKKQGLNSVNLGPFDVEKKGSHAMSPVFKGQKTVSLGEDEVAEMKSSTEFEIILKIDVKYSSKAGKEDVKDEFQVECDLKVPLNSGGTFEETKCKKVFPYLDR